jgi:hypothetical protein
MSTKKTISKKISKSKLKKLVIQEEEGEGGPLYNQVQDLDEEKNQTDKNLLKVLDDMGQSEGKEEEREEDKEDKEDNEDKEDKKDEKNVISLLLGDILRIKAPTNAILNNNTFIIDYIDSTKIILINIEELNTVRVKINEDGTLGDNTITEITLVYRNDNLGYARQNGLLPNTWVNIYFGGEIPTIITGEITELLEDRIELTTSPDKDVLYINFAYKGIPEDIPIENIEIREPPDLKGVQLNMEDEERIRREREEKKEEAKEENKEETNEATNEDNNEKEEKKEERSERKEENDEEEMNEILDEYDEFIAPVDPNIKDHIREFILDADELQFGEEVGEITQLVNVEKGKERYDINVQTNDLLDEMLSTVPTNQRTTAVLNNIHTMIARFKQLRNDYSIFDERNTIKGFIKLDAQWKPLSENLKNFKQLLYWILPVAKNIKKIYDTKIDIDDYSDIIPINITEDIARMSDIIKMYKTNDMPDEQNKYVTLMNELNPYFTPFQDINRESLHTIISEFDVVNDLNVIINNLEDFMSTTYSVNNRTRFLMNRYTTGLQRLDVTQMTGSKMISRRAKLTQSDLLALKSVVTLPEPAITFSHINLPGTDILMKANINTVFLNYWQLLNNKTNINNVIVDDLSKELNFDDMNYVDNIKQYILQRKINRTDEAERLDETDIKTMREETDAFLKTIVPKTKVLFDLVKKYIKGKLSLHDVVGYLEPFLIYTKDLTYFQYKEINKFLQDKISAYNKNFIDKSRTFSYLKGQLLRISNPIPSKNSITKLIPEHNGAAEKILSKSSNSNSNDSMMKYKVGTIFENVYNYSPNKSPLTSAELLRKMILNDYGSTFNTTVTMEQLYLMIPENIGDMLDENTEQINNRITEEGANDKCKNYIIAKQYSSVDDLMLDNDKSIYFDKKFDTTQYSMIDDYEKYQMKMLPEEFHEYLTKELLKKYKLDTKSASYLAETLINGIKKVVNGCYAIVYSNDNTYLYYKREHNRWIVDNNVDAASIDLSKVANSQNLLCNAQPDCIETERIGQINCESIDLNKSTVTKNVLKKMVDEFDKTYTVSKEKIEKEIARKFGYCMAVYEKLNTINQNKTFKYNTQQFQLGLSADNIDELNSAADEDIKRSPYIKLRDLVLGQSDFVKKQHDIVKFAERFTREAIDTVNDKINEDLYWRYCIETKAKLLPTFLYTLAGCFLNDPDNYLNQTNIIIKEIGTISDDGDSWVDKHSGYIIKKIDFDTEEGYDEGFKIKSREIMEQDMGDVIESAIEKEGKKKEEKENKKRVFATSSLSKKEQAQLKSVQNIISTLARDMGLNIEDQREFMIKVAMDTLPTAIPSESVYKEQAADMAKKNKEVPAYKVVYSQLLLYITFGAFLIGIQVKVPDIKTRKTFPGCVKSFEGYPFIETDKDMPGLKYLACVAYKLRSPTDPWSVLMKKKDTYIADKLYNIINTYLIKNVDVVRKIKEKNEYLAERRPNEMENIPAEHNITRWTQFLPPLKPFKIIGLENISTSFKKMLLDDIKSASSSQREKILIIESKIIYFSLAIQEKIQEVIAKKQLLLANGANEPYLENACCNEKGTYNTIKYFESEDSDIRVYNNIVEDLTNILYDIQAITKAPFLFCKKNDKSIYPALSDTFTEETIYQAFIIFCKFNSNAPMSENLLRICKDKPDFLIKKGIPIAEKIRKLKQNDRHYTNKSFLHLLQEVNRENIIKNINLEPIVIPSIQKIRTRIELIRKDDSETTLPAELIDSLDTLLDTFDTVLPEDEDTIELRNMKDYLIGSSTKMKTQIKDFIKQNARLNASTLKNITNVITNVMKWTNAMDKRVVGAGISDDNTYNAIQFMKEYLTNMVTIFPQIILNKVDYNTVSIPGHWGISDQHVMDAGKIIREYYAKLRVFYNDRTLTAVLSDIQKKCKNLLLLANDSPVFTDIVNGEKTIYSIFNKEIGVLLFENYFLQVLTEYMKLSDNIDMIVREGLNEDEMDELEERGRSLMPRLEAAIFEGEKKDLKVKTVKLLVTFLNIMSEHKDIVDLSYDKIMDNVFKSKEKEKDTFTDRLQGLTREERDIDTTQKFLKLGVWSTEEGRFVYNKKNYDRDKKFKDAQSELDNKLRKMNPNVTDNNVEQFLDDLLEEQRMGNEIDEEDNDLRGILNENDDDFDYEQDNDNDFDNLGYNSN